MLVCTTYGSRTSESNVPCTTCGSRDSKRVKKNGGRDNGNKGYAYSSHNIFKSVSFKSTLALGTKIGCAEKAIIFHYCYHNYSLDEAVLTDNFNHDVTDVGPACDAGRLKQKNRFRLKKNIITVTQLLHFFK